jgi:hypothetical protein
MDDTYTIRALSREEVQRLTDGCASFGSGDYHCHGDVLYETRANGTRRLVCLLHAEKFVKNYNEARGPYRPGHGTELLHKVKLELPPANRLDGKLRALSVEECREFENKKKRNPDTLWCAAGFREFRRFFQVPDECEQPVVYEASWHDHSEHLTRFLCLEHARRFAEMFAIPLPPPNEIPGPKLVRAPGAPARVN